ncbi:capsular polysaccharide synthesis protein [Pseudomonas khavaziana]|uniref:capsular polysaccharide synthesis protein n=1 Tax=Pseudomonas khavaziana TaxID=2842351 RepID=UPI001C3D4972|nr:capsular polysaccharide synthesis protein [Pseudomonas khavaziana]MBV4483916.1 capsular polysaccharide synthesis protein [Pseudomonas khavaziana]
MKITYDSIAKKKRRHSQAKDHIRDEENIFRMSAETAHTSQGLSRFPKLLAKKKRLPSEPSSHAQAEQRLLYQGLNTKFRSYLHERGDQIIPNSGKGNNCAIYAIVQQIRPNLTTEALDVEVSNIRKQYDIRYPNDRGRMLYFDNFSRGAAPALIEIINSRYDINIEVKVISAGLDDAAPEIDHGSYRASDTCSPGWQLIIWDQQGHYEAVIPPSSTAFRTRQPTSDSKALSTGMRTPSPRSARRLSVNRRSVSTSCDPLLISLSEKLQNISTFPVKRNTVFEAGSLGLAVLDKYEGTLAAPFIEEGKTSFIQLQNYYLSRLSRKKMQKAQEHAAAFTATLIATQFFFPVENRDERPPSLPSALLNLWAHLFVSDSKIMPPSSGASKKTTLVDIRTAGTDDPPHLTLPRPYRTKMYPQADTKDMAGRPGYGKRVSTGEAVGLPEEHENIMRYGGASNVSLPMEVIPDHVTSADSTTPFLTQPNQVVLGASLTSTLLAAGLPSAVAVAGVTSIIALFSLARYLLIQPDDSNTLADNIKILGTTCQKEEYIKELLNHLKRNGIEGCSQSYEITKKNIIEQSVFVLEKLKTAALNIIEIMDCSITEKQDALCKTIKSELKNLAEQEAPSLDKLPTELLKKLELEINSFLINKADNKRSVILSEKPDHTLIALSASIRNVINERIKNHDIAKQDEFPTSHPLSPRTKREALANEESNHFLLRNARDTINEKMNAYFSEKYPSEDKSWTELIAHEIDQDNLEPIARIIQKVHFEYGGESNENLTPAQSLNIVKDFFFLFAAEKSFVSYLFDRNLQQEKEIRASKEIESYCITKYPDDAKMASITSQLILQCIAKEMLYDSVVPPNVKKYIQENVSFNGFFYFIDNFNKEEITLNSLLYELDTKENQTVNLFHKVWDYFVGEEIPILHLNKDIDKKISLSDPAFLKSYVASSFIKDIAIQTGGDYKKELASLTQKQIDIIYDVIFDLLKNSTSDSNYLSYFFVPAIFYNMKHNPDKITTLPPSNIFSLIDDMLIQVELSKQFDRDHKKFIDAMKEIPSRTDFAKTQIRMIQTLRDIGNKKNNSELTYPTKGKASPSENLLIDVLKATSNNINNRYKEKLEVDIGAPYFNINNYYLRNMFAGYFYSHKEEESFITSNSSIIYSAQLVEVNIKYSMLGVMTSRNVVRKEITNIIKDRDFLIVRNNGLDRYYVMEPVNGTYAFSRLARDPFNDIRTEGLNRQETYYTAPQNAYMIKNNNSPFAYRGFIDHFNALCRRRFIDEIYDKNYDASVLEIMESIGKHLVPFYDCIKEYKNKNYETSALSCTMDLLTVLPFLGEALSISSNLANGIIDGAITYRSLARLPLSERVNAGFLALEKGIPNAGKTVSLIQSGLLMFDPGFSLVYQSGKLGVKAGPFLLKWPIKKINELESFLEALKTKTDNIKSSRNQKDYQHILELFEEHANRIESKRRSQKDRILTLPGTDVALPYRVIGKTFVGEDIVAFVDESGNLAGKRYKEKNNELFPIPCLTGKSKRSPGEKDCKLELIMTRNFENIIADASVSKAIVVRSDNTLYSVINTYLTPVVYDVEYNAFIAISSGKAYQVDKTANALRPLTATEMNSRYKSEIDEERIASLKSLGFNVDVRALESREPNKTPIPKKIYSLWVGPKEISPQNIENIIHNARYAKSKGFEYTLFLSKASESSFNKNSENLKEVGENIAVLEESPEYVNFMKRKNHDQFLDALGNNEFKNTNFASAADILRYHLLYERGGIYIDADDKLTTDFAEKDLIASNNDILLSTPVSNSALDMYVNYNNNFIGTHEGNKIFENLLDEIFIRYQRNKDFYKSRPAVNDVKKMSAYVKKISELTGPGVFNDIISQHLPKAEKVLSLARFLNKGGVEISKEHAFKFSAEFRNMLIDVYYNNDVTLLADMADAGNDHTWVEHRR